MKREKTTNRGTTLVHRTRLDYIIKKETVQLSVSGIIWINVDKLSR